MCRSFIEAEVLVQVEQVIESGFSLGQIQINAERYVGDALHAHILQLRR